MTPRSPLVVVTVAVLVVISGVLAGGRANQESVASTHRSTSAALAGAPVAALAAPATVQPARSLPGGRSQAAVVSVAVASVLLAGHRRVTSVRPERLDDVGDGWRALLLGAPPQRV
jgi:hypothetical protein